MRKIISEEERNRKVRRNQLIIGAVLILLMVFSTLSFAFINRTSLSISADELKYNGVKFIKGNDGYWEFSANGNDFLTIYNPKETEDINFSSYLNVQNYHNKPLYFAGEEGDHFSEIARNLESFVLRTSKTCLEGEECAGDFPVKDCSNNIIIFKTPKENEEEKIYQEENCIFIIADYTNQIRYADAFLFSLLKIK